MNVLRLGLPALVAVALSACGGGGGGSIFGGNPGCQPGTQVQVARPAPNQFDSNVNSVEIVASGSSDNIHSNPSNWYVYAQSNAGTQIFGGPLSPVSDNSGPHPFTQDFFYSSQLQNTLPSGQNWTVYLAEQNTGCSPVAIPGSFST